MDRVWNATPFYHGVRCMVRETRVYLGDLEPLLKKRTADGKHIMQDEQLQWVKGPMIERKGMTTRLLSFDL